jgi:glucosamine-6-phosphate deaminase
MVSLAPETIAANAEYFDDPEQMPAKALTVGIGTLMQAKSILLLVSGKSKAEIVYRFLCGNITPEVPATVLRLHQNVTAVLDEDALSVVRQRAPERLRQLLG